MNGQEQDGDDERADYDRDDLNVFATGVESVNLPSLAILGAPDADNSELQQEADAQRQGDQNILQQPK